METPTSGAQATDQIEQNTPPAATPTPAPAGNNWAAAAQDPAQPAQTLPPAPGQPAPAAEAPAPTVIASTKPQGLLGIVQGIADVLGGTTRPETYKDADGNEYVRQRAATGGEKWARIGSDLIHGAAAGFAAGRGNNPGAALAAGVEAGDKQNQQRKNDETQMTEEARQATLDNANHQMLQMRKAELAMAMAQQNLQMNHEVVNFAQGRLDHMVKPTSEGGEGGTILGTMSAPNQLRDILKVNPDVMQDMIEKHQIELMPHYDNDGKAAGFTVVKMPDGYRTQVLPAGSSFHTFDQTTGKMVEHKSADPLTVGERDSYNDAAMTAAQAFTTKKAAADKAAADLVHVQAQTKQANSETAKNYAQAKLLNEATDGNQIQSNAQQLVQGTMDPANLSRRSKSYDATLSAANAISMSTTGKPFDVAKAAGDYKYATNPQTYNTLNFLNSLTGRDNQSGNLGTVVTMSQQLGQGKFPPLNNVEQWAKISAGHPEIAAYRAALTETSDQIAKILQGGGSGNGTSDAKLKQASELLDQNFNAAQIKATADTLRTLLANRKQEIIGDNRYLERWHGGAPGAPQQQQQQPSVNPNSPPPGMVSPTKFQASDGTTHWVAAANLDAAKKIDPKLQVIQ